MELTKNTWHYRFWKANYGYSGWSNQEPTNNFCDYFWQLSGAIIMLPLTWIGILINKINNERNRFEELVAITLGSYSLFSIIGLLIAVAIIETFMFFIILGTIIGVICLIVAIVWGGSMLSSSNNIKETKQIISEGWKSFKGKYCPTINWDSKK